MIFYVLTHHKKHITKNLALFQKKVNVLYPEKMTNALPQKKAHRKEGWEKEEKAGCLKKIVLKTMYVFAYECKS